VTSPKQGSYVFLDVSRIQLDIKKNASGLTSQKTCKIIENMVRFGKDLRGHLTNIVFRDVKKLSSRRHMCATKVMMEQGLPPKLFFHPFFG